MNDELPAVERVQRTTSPAGGAFRVAYGSTDHASFIIHHLAFAVPASYLLAVVILVAGAFAAWMWKLPGPSNAVVAGQTVTFARTGVIGQPPATVGRIIDLRGLPVG